MPQKRKTAKTANKCKYAQVCMKDNMGVNKKYISILEKSLKTEKNLEERKKMENELSILKNKKILDSVKQKCDKTFCNIGCKNTLFSVSANENGKNVSTFLTKKYKNDKHKTKSMKKMKKILCGKDGECLTSNFYKKLKPEFINKIKKQGAISGCTNFESDVIFLDY